MCVWCTATTIFLSSPHFLLKLSELVYLIRADMIKITSVGNCVIGDNILLNTKQACNPILVVTV